MLIKYCLFQGRFSRNVSLNHGTFTLCSRHTHIMMSLWQITPPIVSDYSQSALLYISLYKLYPVYDSI
jgi:hypothetical protein